MTSYALTDSTAVCSAFYLNEKHHFLFSTDDNSTLDHYAKKVYYGLYSGIYF